VLKTIGINSVVPWSALWLRGAGQTNYFLCGAFINKLMHLSRHFSAHNALFASACEKQKGRNPSRDNLGARKAKTQFINGPEARRN
jgi:hypothetical protein